MNRHIILIILTLLLTVSTQAQKRITHEYHNVSLSDALRQLSEQQTGYTIYFLYNELEDFRITTTVKNKRLPEAIHQMIGFYPIRVTTSSDEDGKKIFVECTHKTDLHLTGTIIDEQGQPVAYANIAILNPVDSTLLCGGVSNESGIFVIPIDQTNIIVRISYVGYKTIYKQCNNTELGTIRMQPETQTLKGVTVKGQRLLYTATDNGLKVTVQGTPLEQFGSVTDMLTHLPLMMSDGTIAGHGKPEIYINNKKVRNESELDRLRADEILSAEIITNPGAEYGADISSVIRLKTVRKAGEGWSGNYSAAYRQGEQWYGNINAALNYRTRNGMDFFVKGYLTENNELMDYTSQTELKTSSVWTYDSRMHWHNHNIYYFADLGWNWEINDHHSVGLTYTAFSRIGSNWGNIEQDERVWQDGKLFDEGHTSTDNSYKTKMSHSVNTYYNGEIGKWKIDFSADYYGERDYTEMEGLTNGQSNASSNTTTKNRLLAEKLTITAPVPYGNLTFGEEVSNVDRSNDFLQSGFSADDHIHQMTTTWSLYANYSLQVKKFSFNAGLRWQNEHNRYEQNGQMQDEMSPDYHVIIPNLSVSRKSDQWRHTLSYRGYRYNPPYGSLSSAVIYAGKYEYRTGNPYLQPQTHDIISWETNWKWMNIELQYDYIKNRYSDFHTIYDETNHPGVRLMDYRTTPTIKKYRLIFNAAPKIGIWQLNYTASLEYNDEDLELLGITHSFKGLCTEFNLDNTFTLPKAWLLNIQGYIEPYYRSGFKIMKTSGSLNLRLSKQFLKDKSLSVALLARDFLRTDYVKGTEYNGIGYRIDVETYRDRRRIGIDLSWKFNATRSRYKGSHAGQSERNRL
jgi:hypothetical protein